MTGLEYDSGIISAAIHGGRRNLIAEVRFLIERGASLSVVGETGAGKTTIALSIMRLLPDNVLQEGGETLFCGSPLLPERCDKKYPLGREIVYIPQSGADCLNPAENVKQHLYENLKRLGFRKSECKELALANLKRAGFENPEEVFRLYPFQLSGGMAQRVTIAIALCSNAKLVICDEPTCGFDARAKAMFLKNLNDLFPSAAKLVFTHDIDVARHCDAVGVLLGGKLLEYGSATEVLLSPRHPYTRALWRALAQNGMRQSPVLRKQKGDCPFFSRCPLACDRCDAISVRTDGAHGWRCVQW